MLAQEPKTPEGPETPESSPTEQSPEGIAAWLEGFLSTPNKQAPKPEKIEAKPSPVERGSDSPSRPPPSLVLPATVDALVLFVERAVCGCGREMEVGRFVGLRKPIPNGHAYLAFESSMSSLVGGLPRYRIETRTRVYFCAGCFGGVPAPDDEFRSLHVSSRVTPETDLGMFVKARYKVRREERPEAPALDPSGEQT